MKKILWIILAVGLVFSLAGCDWLASVFAAMAAPHGYVINAKEDSDSQGIAGVTLTMTYLGAPPEGEETPGPFSGTTSDTGYYNIPDVAYGTYEVVASKSGYTFIKQVVTVSGLAQQLPDLVGFPYDAATDSYNISLILMWNEGFDDVDAHLTFPNGDPTIEAVAAMPFDDVYDTSISGTYWDAHYDGFFPEFAAGLVDSDSDGDVDYNDYRVEIYWGNRTANHLIPGTTIPAVSLDVDDTDGRGPETITIAGIPYEDWIDVSSTTGGGLTGLPELTGGSFYAWTGVMEYYIDAYNSGEAGSTGDYLSQVDTGESADAVFYVMQGDALMGIYTIPTYTNISTASVVRINMFYKFDSVEDAYYEFFQIAPDLRVLQSTAQIKGAGNGVINIEGRKVR